MLKIHKGLKKKKKDKKNKRKDDDDLFNEEELEKYRKEHGCSKQPASSADLSLAQQTSNSGAGSGSGDGDSSAGGGAGEPQSDEWQKFKALTAGVDTILQKTQEDLDRIKSTSFFQRKAPPSEVEKQKQKQLEEEREREHEQQQQQQQQRDNEQEVAGEAVDFASGRKSESEYESEEEVAVDDTLFDTSYVDAVASGELKLAYIPDSPPADAQDDYDLFDTSYANKFIESNPKKRYLNLGCAVQVLSGRAVDSTSGAQFATAAAEKRSPRRRVKPVDLLLTSFDEGAGVSADPVADSRTVLAATAAAVTPVDSPVKTLLDDDDDVTLAAPLSVAPLPIPSSTAAVAAAAGHHPAVAAAPPKVDLSDFELDEFDVLAANSSGAVLPAAAAAAAAAASSLGKQASSDSATDDEFAQLAAASLARKSSSALPTPTADTDDSAALNGRHACGQPFDAQTPSAQFIAAHPLQPIVAAAAAEPEEIDPFDTSIVAKVILPGRQEIKLLEKELLSDIAPVSTPHPATGTAVGHIYDDDDDDDDFDPRAGESSSCTAKPIRPQELAINQRAAAAASAAANQPDAVSPSKKPDFLKIEEIDVEVAKPLTPLAVADQRAFDEPQPEYDPFDTSHVCGAPGKLELKLIESELTRSDPVADNADDDNDFDPRKYDATANSITHAILNKYSCNPQPVADQCGTPVVLDILTGTREDDREQVVAAAPDILPTPPLQPPSLQRIEIAYSDPFDTSIADNIRPGKVELKLLETELVTKY